VSLRVRDRQLDAAEMSMLCFLVGEWLAAEQCGSVQSQCVCSWVQCCMVAAT
jgi:hypothetical protein